MSQKEGVLVIFIKDRSKESSIYACHGLDLSLSESDDDKTMLKEMRARQESVAVNNIHNNSTLSAGRIRANGAYEETKDRSYSHP
jgi:hypothetical protein